MKTHKKKRPQAKGSILLSIALFFAWVYLFFKIVKHYRDAIDQEAKHLSKNPRKKHGETQRPS